jgi:hypothetical protein
MRQPDSGQAYRKLFLTLAVMGVLVYVASQAVPVYINNYQLEEYIRQLAIHASVARSPAGVIQQNVLTYAQDLHLPVTLDQIKVQADKARVKIDVDYTVPVDLKVYTWVLHFTPSSENATLS